MSTSRAAKKKGLPAWHVPLPFHYKSTGVETVFANRLALRDAWDLDELGLRRQLWRNAGELLDRCDLLDRFIGAVQDVLLTVGTH
jgi:hypothetical protein